MIDAPSHNGHEITGYWKDEIMEEAVSAYPAKVREFDATAKRIAHMAGLGRGMELDPKPFWKLNTSLTTSAKLMAFALKPRFTKAEAMEMMRAKYGA